MINPKQLSDLIVKHKFQLSYKQMAEELHISRTTLRRDLVKHGTTWNRVLDATRKSSVEALMMFDYTLEEITEAVGFASVNSLLNKFPDWFDMNYAAYKNQ